MMQSDSKVSEEQKEDRKEVYVEIRDAFTDKYSFLGTQFARETLMSAASWNVDTYSDPPMRFRNHIMLAWPPGWLKSSMMMKMKKILGDDMVGTCGKLTSAVLRGSVKGDRFSPPKPLRNPIVMSTEFGQSSFEDELLHTFLNLLEEGETNVSLNKIAQLSESEKSNIEKKYKGEIDFRSENEFDLSTNFVFWGATHDPSLLEENALKTRFNVVTPAEPLTGEVTEAVDKSPSVESLIDKSTVKEFRRMLKSEKEVQTNFRPPSSLYTKYQLSPRESRDVQAYMAARNWWGLNTDPDVMEEYIKHMKRSRRIASLSMDERVLDLIFNEPMTYDEIMEKTGLTKIETFKILQRIDAQRAGMDSERTEWVVRSGESELNFKNNPGDTDKDQFLDDLL